MLLPVQCVEHVSREMGVRDQCENLLARWR